MLGICGEHHPLLHSLALGHLAFFAHVNIQTAEDAPKLDPSLKLVISMDDMSVFIFSPLHELRSM